MRKRTFASVTLPAAAATGSAGARVTRGGRTKARGVLSSAEAKTAAQNKKRNSSRCKLLAAGRFRRLGRAGRRTLRESDLDILLDLASAHQPSCLIDDFSIPSDKERCG